MKFKNALTEVLDTLRASGTPLTSTTLAAMRYLEGIAPGVEDIASSYIESIDIGPLEAWIEANEKHWEDLDDQRLFDTEHFKYTTAHAILGLPVQWPEGYEEKT